MTEEQSYHEIQLTGKQLVFFFMAATAVSVVIFLCGVLVGKGVRPRLDTVAAQSAPEPAADVGTRAPRATVPVPHEEAPAEVKDQLSYYDRLAGKEEPDAQKPPVSAAPTPADAAAEAPAPPPEDPAAIKEPAGAPSRTTKPEPPQGPAAAAPATPPPAAPPVASPAPSEPVGAGYAVQVAAVKVSADAEALVKQLTAKGYHAYLVPPEQPGSAGVYRVRVGKFADRATAEEVAKRLATEEHFKPWITK